MPSIFRVTILLSPSNALLPIEITELGTLRSPLILVQFAKADEPIVVRLLFKFTLSREVQP